MGSRDIAGMVNTYIRGNLLLLKFYLQSIAKVHSLPKWMRNPDTLKEVVNAKIENGELEHFTLTLPNNTAKEYNDGLENMKGEMRKLHAGEKEMFSYKTTLLLLFLLRFLCIVTAWYGNVVGTLAISSAQFLIAPYSLFVSFTLSLALAPPIYLCHYLSFYILQSLLSLLTLVTPPLLLDIASYLSPYLYLPIGPVFITLFFICDQAICLYCHLCTPSREFTVRETMIHAVWGFLNTKTYTIVILLHMMNAGVCIPVVIWLLDWWLGLTLKLSDIISGLGAHWAELFYTQHRMAHLPKVYEHAHKLHHYLHGTLAFDAHIYGNGMPEEWFFLLVELLSGVTLGLIPATLNRLVLQYSVDNKFGHTQKPEDTCGDNFHADHHLLHVKNYGIYNCLMDMYFNTSNHNDKYLIMPTLYCPGGEHLVYQVEKKIEQENTVFIFTPNK